MTTINFLMPRSKTATSTKTFKIDKSGKWVKFSDYNAGKLFKGFECPAENIEDAFSLLEQNMEYNCFMIHGGFIDNTNLENIHRRSRERKDGVKPTLTNRPVNFFCLDIDGYPGTIAEFIHKELPEVFHTADFVYQYSASYGLTEDPEILKCHLFFWLEEAVMNTDLRDWAKTSEIPNLDPAPLNAAQPVYIQRRVCEGGIDPIETLIDLVKKDGPLKWKPEAVAVGNLTNLGQKKKIVDYDMQKAIENIRTADNYHDAIRSTALSMLNRKTPASVVRATLKGLMEAESTHDERWQARYDDIDRAVDTAQDIIDEITIEDFQAWAASASKDDVTTDYAQKCLKFNPVELNIAFNLVNRITGHGLRDIRAQFKIVKAETNKELARIANELRTEERRQQGIYEIELTVEHLAKAYDQARKVLAESEKLPLVFCFGNGLASVVNEQPKTISQCSKKHSLGIDYPPMPIIKPYRAPLAILHERMSRDIVFVDESGKDIPPSNRLLNSMIDGDQKAFRPLTGVVEHPFIDDNWQIVQKNGYDDGTGLYTILHDKLKVLNISPEKAYRYLTEVVFDEFPFASDLDKAVAVAAMCTAVQRPVVTGSNGMPGFGIVSPTQSSGKTTLAQLISHAIYNRPVAAQSWTNDGEEMAKHLLAILQEGHPCVLFDNIKEGSLVKSDKLASAMTTEVVSGRQLGENRTAKAPSSVVWLFTGNQIAFVGDFATRVYPIIIEPDSENPDARKFKRTDVGQWAMDNRKKIISALIAIIQGGKNKGPLKDSSRFVSWDKFVRIPVYHASGGIDVNEAIKVNQKEDPEKSAKKQVLQTLFDEFKEKEFTAKDVKTRAFGSFEAGETDLGDALVEAMDDRAKSPKSIGRYLARMFGIKMNGLVLKKKVSNITKWRIVNTNEEEK